MKTTTKRRHLGLCALAALIMVLVTPLSADLVATDLVTADLVIDLARDAALEVKDSEATAMIGGFGGDIFGTDCLIGFTGLGLGLLAGAVIAASGGTALVVVAIAGAYAPAIGIAIC